MHHRAGEFYRDTESNSYLAALHFERSRDSEEAIDLIVRDHWKIINQGYAVALADLVAQFDDEGLELERRLELDLQRGRIHGLLGQSQLARDDYDRVHDLAPYLDEDATQDEFYARVCLGMGELLEEESPEEALNWLQQGIECCDGQSESISAALHIQQGTIQFYMGDLTGAKESLERGLELLPAGPSQLRVKALRDLGNISFFLDSWDEAIDFAHQALRLNDLFQDFMQAANIHLNLGMYHAESGEWKTARAEFEEALRLSRLPDLTKQTIYLEVNLGTLFIDLGEDEQAYEHLYKGLQLAIENKNHRFEFLATCGTIDLDIKTNHLEGLASKLKKAEVLAPQLGNEAFQVMVDNLYAEYYLALGETQPAFERVEQARVTALKNDLRDSVEHGQTFFIRGQIFGAQGDLEKAIADLERGLAIIESQNKYRAARVKVSLGLATIDIGEEEAGRALLGEARATFLELDAKRDLLEVNRALK
jgi:tetratricopeptide (TPR) repeat protein